MNKSVHNLFISNVPRQSADRDENPHDRIPVDSVEARIEDGDDGSCEDGVESGHSVSHQWPRLNAQNLEKDENREKKEKEKEKERMSSSSSFVMQSAV